MHIHQALLFRMQCCWNDLDMQKVDGALLNWNKDVDADMFNYSLTKGVL